MLCSVGSDNQTQFGVELKFSRIVTQKLYRPFPTDSPLEPGRRLSLTVSEIVDGKCDAMVDMTLKRHLKRSRSFVLVLIDSSHTTSYRLSVVTVALGCTVWPQDITSQTTDRSNTVA